MVFLLSFCFLNGSFILQANVLSGFLCEKGFQKWADVPQFKYVNVEFDWQRDCSTAGYVDCGLYMMMHFLLYNGRPFSCGLADKNTRDLYRAEIVATLVLSDINLVRGDVLEKVEAFEGTKESALPDLVKKRREEDHKELLEKMNEYSAAVGRCTDSGPSSVLGSRKRLSKAALDDGLGCTIDCGLGFTKPLLVSKHMRDNLSPFEDITLLRKHVMDYAFLVDYRYLIE